jgi:BlaI family penicillinase repressor
MITVVIPMKKIPRISETEWQVMKIVWAQTPCSAGEIIEALACQDPDWHPKTARTLLNRLVAKKALTFTAAGRTYVYRPLVTEEDCVDAASDSFLERVFGGSLQPMLAHFVERRKLSPAQIKELKRLLESR